jgi:hypothetical protein
MVDQGVVRPGGTIECVIAGASLQSSLRDEPTFSRPFDPAMNRWASASLKTFDQWGESPHEVYVTNL